MKTSRRQRWKLAAWMPGMFLAHGYHPPIKSDEYTHCGTAWALCLEIPAQVLKPVWDIWDYDGDVAFLEQRVSPALRDLADFYAGYVSKGADGCCHVIPTVLAGGAVPTRPRDCWPP